MVGVNMLTSGGIYNGLTVSALSWPSLVISILYEVNG
jgi:hypothetical protein